MAGRALKAGEKAGAAAWMRLIGRLARLWWCFAVLGTDQGLALAVKQERH